MNKFEYDFLTGKWEGPKGAAYNACHEHCRGMGWFVGLTAGGVPILSSKGLDAVQAYERGQK
jgi:hypothetical protein